MSQCGGRDEKASLGHFFEDTKPFMGALPPGPGRLPKAFLHSTMVLWVYGFSPEHSTPCFLRGQKGAKRPLVLSYFWFFPLYNTGTVMFASYSFP